MSMLFYGREVVIGGYPVRRLIMINLAFSGLNPHHQHPLRTLRLIIYSTDTRSGPALRAAPGSREPGCREPGAKALGSGGSRRGARAEETAAECT